MSSRQFFLAISASIFVLTAGCVKQNEPEFAMRNVHDGLDLPSIVRSQSNGLLLLSTDIANDVQQAGFSRRRLVDDLAGLSDQLEQLQLDLPALLASQDVEIASLEQLVRDGAVERSALKQKQRNTIRFRKELIGSLSSTTAQTSDALQLFEARGYPEMATTTKSLLDDLKATRTIIEMQL